MQFSLSSMKSVSKAKVILALAVLAVFLGVGMTGYLTGEAPKPAAFIPAGTLTLAGRGGLEPLHMAMRHDGHLKDMVTALGDVPPIDIFTRETQVDMKVADILFRWAGADMAEKGAYGPYIDARVAAFLRRIGSVPASFMPGTEIPIKDAANLTQLWFKVFEHYRIRLLAQTAGQSIYEGKAAYNTGTDALTVNGPISPAFIAAFQKELQTSSNSGAQMRAFLDFINDTKGFSRLTDPEQDMIMSLKADKAPASARAGSPGRNNPSPANTAP